MNIFAFSKKNRNKALIVFISLVFIFNFYQSHAQFTPGDLIVYRVDNGSSSLNTASAVNVYLDEYATMGTAQTPVTSIALPATSTTAGFTESGKATSDGLMHLSTNDQSLVFPGYLAKLGTANIVISSSTTYPRIIGLINSGEVVNTTTEITDGYNNNNIRSACSDDGTEFWTGGNDVSSGTRYVAALGNTTSAALSTAQSSTNSIFIIDGQLYTSVRGNGIYAVGAGLPTTSGQSMTLLPSTNSGAGEDFVLFDVNGSSFPQLLYIADQTNGIYKYTSTDGTTWTQVGTYLAVTGGTDGITGYVDCNGNAQLFFTDNPGLEGNNLWGVTDNNAYASGTAISGTATKLATASSISPHQSGFRGVAFAPIASYPTVVAGAASPTLCEGGSNDSIVAEEEVGTSEVQGVTYTWSPSTGLSATTGMEVAASPTVTTTYTVEASSPYLNTSSLPVTGEGCISATVVITVNQLITADAGNAPAAICSTSSYTVTNASVADDSSYSWTSSSGCNACFSSTKALNPVYTPNTTDINNGSVTITLTAYAYSPCENATATKTITITKSPIANSGNNSDTAICPGSTYTITNASVANNTSFSWTSSSGCNSCFNSTATLNPLYTPSSTDITNGVVTLTLIALGNSPCGNDTSSKIITIDTGAHAVTVLPLSPTVCNGESVSLYISASGNNFNWTPSTGLNVSTGDTVISTPTSSIRYTVSGTDSFGCKSIGTDSVTVGPAPPLTITSASSTCAGQSITLSVPLSGKDYVWSPSTTLSSSTGDNVIATPAGNTTYTVTGIDSVGCTAKGMDTITVTEGPNKPTIFLDNNVVLTSTATQGNQWYKEGTMIDGATNETYTISDTGCYWVIATNPANGCSSISDTLCVTSLTGINTLSINPGLLSIYPNPTNGEIAVNISSSIGQVKDWYLQITDVLGRTVYTGQALNYSNDIDLSNLPGGVYFIMVINKSGRTVVPVVKQ